MPNHGSNHDAKPKPMSGGAKSKKTKSKKSSMKSSKKSMKSGMSSSSSSGQMAYCMHGCKKMVKMVDATKKVITMKNGNKRAQMVGKCAHCGGKVFAFVKM